MTDEMTTQDPASSTWNSNITVACGTEYATSVDEDMSGSHDSVLRALVEDQQRVLGQEIKNASAEERPDLLAKAAELSAEKDGILGVVQPPVSPPRSDILRDAHAAICNDRNASYGEPRDNFSAIAQMWTIYLQKKLGHLENLSAKDVGDLFILAKMGRNIHGNTTRDTYVDIAGYAACAWECDVACPQ